MRCRKCSEKAAINMRHHKLALCSTHFLEWVPNQVDHTIRKYQMFTRQERILLAVSGGKDSLSLWDVLCHLGYSVDGLYIGLGIDAGTTYSSDSEKFIHEFVSSRNLNLLVIDVEKEYGKNVPEMWECTHRGRLKPCSICGIVKRHIMNRIAREKNYDVLLTGHNLDDEAAVLFSNTLNWIPGYLVRQSPILENDRPGVVRKAKPLCQMYERETAAYALLRGINYIYAECPFADGSNTLYYKELLNQLENDRPGSKLSFYLSFLHAKENGLFAPQADPDLEKIHPCPNCGQVTTSPGTCTFCRLINGKQPDS